MDIPGSLAEQLCLLGYDPRRERVVTGLPFPYLLRAAALTDLLLRGRIADDGGRVRVLTEEAVGDPVLDDLLAVLAASPPRTWRHWIGKDRRRTVEAVLDRLEGQRLVRRETRKQLLIFSSRLVRVRDTRVARRLAARVDGALTGPVSRVDARDAALVALAAAGEVGTVLPSAKRREHRQRIAQLTERSGPAAPALRSVVRQARAAYSG
ncbi:GOLPH3/VPS74 family protein [Microbispora sp. ATCC PTA-5024]|uniref:GOLPH3/VPS74 family protein n=1 Tax=Microbispora sp. ATCC PTA-5024 TaxID=316330 RepID=UPI0003DD9B9E|nr:GPP34 family phosphoprotein [Microbispora sp. ATCC PTA-5024]ETK37429.1 hypothetical protein MPTA5024_03955 [Microbispora sp. ATCC PTA-5024]